MVELTKGMRVHAEWLEAAPMGSSSLAGVMLKTTAVIRTATGIVTHIRGDHPTDPTSVGVWILTDDGQEVVTDARNIVAVDGAGIDAMARAFDFYDRVFEQGRYRKPDPDQDLQQDAAWEPDDSIPF